MANLDRFVNLNELPKADFVGGSRECREMFCCGLHEKLIHLGGQFRPARKKSSLMTSFSIGKAKARLEQLWCTIAIRGMSVSSNQCALVLPRKAFSIPSKT